MWEGIKHFKFEDEDMIIKLTGRYLLDSPYLLKLAEDHPEVDAIAKPFADGVKVFTGCFAMKCKHFKEMLSQLDYEEMEEYLIDIEEEVATYLKKLEMRGGNVVYVDHMDVTAYVAGGGVGGDPTLTRW